MDLHHKAPPPREPDPLLHAAARWLIASRPEGNLTDPQETVAWRQHPSLPGMFGQPLPQQGRAIAEELALLQQYKSSLERPRIGKCPNISQQIEQVKAAVDARTARLAAAMQLAAQEEK